MTIKMWRNAAMMTVFGVGLTACGGATTGGGGVTPALPTYYTLSSTAAATSTLGGSSLRVNTVTNNYDVGTITGSLRHNTGGTTISDGLYTLSDGNGPDANGTLTDGASTLTLTDGVGSTYDYVTAYRQTYTAGGQAYKNLAVVGIITKTADMPTAGAARYTGAAVGAMAYNSGPVVTMKNATATVDANFGGGTVNVDMSGFQAFDATSGLPAGTPAQQITIDNMTISGAHFSGGNVTFRTGGSVVSAVGTGATSQAQGAFFGYNSSAGMPDEVAGVMAASGSTGFLTTTFVAD